MTEPTESSHFTPNLATKVAQEAAVQAAGSYVLTCAGRGLPIRDVVAGTAATALEATEGLLLQALVDAGFEAAVAEQAVETAMQDFADRIDALLGTMPSQVGRPS